MWMMNFSRVYKQVMMNEIQPCFIYTGPPSDVINLQPPGGHILGAGKVIWQCICWRSWPEQEMSGFVSDKAQFSQIANKKANVLNM